MPDFLETTLDKFTFRVATDRWYSREGVWARPDQGLITVGVSDFLQQHNGDVAFAEVKPAGSLLEAGDELAVIETIKVDIVLSTPVPGRVAEINPALDTGPEVINFEPYGQGWLAVIDPQDWERDRAALLDPQAYFELMCSLAEAELRQP